MHQSYTGLLAFDHLPSAGYYYVQSWRSGLERIS